MKSEHLIHIKAKFECLKCRRRSLNVRPVVLENVMQMKFEHLIHIKEKSERLILQKTKSKRLTCCARKCDADEVLTSDPYKGEV